MSLRDVERVLEVMSWFYSQTQGKTDLFKQMEDEKTDSEEEDEEEELAEDMEMEDQIVPLHQVGTKLMQVLGRAVLLLVPMIMIL